MKALYIHIPFCQSKCAYCDFDSRPVAAGGSCEVERYLGLVLDRIDSFGRHGALGDVLTVYIGGGTPTLLGERLAGLVRRVRAWCDPVEFTCEANPESLSPGLARALRSAGVTRLSIGVQSLEDAELSLIGRVHTAEGATDALRLAVSLGFATSCDLICGLPRQTSSTWESSVRGVLACGVDHVSVYPLTIEEGTRLERMVADDPALGVDEDFQAACMERAEAILAEAGLQRYEVASYARPGFACRHNIAYWTGVSYLGIGRSAAGMLSTDEFWQISPLFDGCPGMPAGTARVRFVQTDDRASRFDFEHLSAREAVAEDLMLGMRMSRGVSEGLLGRAGALAGEDRVRATVKRVVGEGLARWDPYAARLVPTERGWLMGNVLFEEFWSLAGGA